jgi:hypothetical protein
MKIQIIKNWLTGDVIFECEANSVKQAVELACKAGVSLSYADLEEANLFEIDLEGYNLSRANFSRANLKGARLYGTGLYKVILTGTELDPIRDDLWAVLSCAPSEVDFLRKALVEGRINGSSYKGACACLIGTIAKACGKKHTELDDLKPDPDRPAERFFLNIERGDTPETSQFSKLALQWVDEWSINVKNK